MPVRIRKLAGDYAIAQLEPTAAAPDWADGEGFVSISRSAEELSVVCLGERVPAGMKADRGWTCYELVGPFAFDETGIALSVIRPLADNGIGIFLVSTFNTDYLLVKTAGLATVERSLTEAGHVLLR